MAAFFPLALYEAALNEITDVCADPWFAEQLARCKAGDETARCRVSTRCLGRVLAIAKRHWRPDSTVMLLDAVREGNTALAKAVEEFSGSTADEFLHQMTDAVERRIVLFLQHPHEA